MLASLKTLLSSIVDYAGVFPPAKLSLEEAIANYARYQTNPYSWMLGSLVLPAAQLDELAALLPAYSVQQWPLSLIIPKAWEEAIAKIQSLNNHKITITALEFPPLPPTEIAGILPHLPAGVAAFFEIPGNQDLEEYLALLQGTQASAKIRTGGLTAEAFPSRDQLSQFIIACSQAQIPFKATAGLHHLLPGKYSLRKEADSSSMVMHGFLNVAILAALAYGQKVTEEEALAVLQESSIDGFQFQGDSISWNEHRLDISELEKARQSFFCSIGSCSFQEPMDELKERF